MAIIEGFRVRNFRPLKDVAMGRLSGGHGKPLTPFTVVIGKNGSGKSSLFDAFGFVADCLATDVETACDIKQRGGYERLLSNGQKGPIGFEVFYREAPNERPISYELSVALDKSGRPFVESEVLKQGRKGPHGAGCFRFCACKGGRGRFGPGRMRSRGPKRRARRVLTWS
jgi:predicted ATPase